MPEDSKKLLHHLTDGFLFLSTSAPNSFIRPFEITEQFALLSTCTIFPNGLGHEISASDCDPSGTVWVAYLFARKQFELDLILVARYSLVSEELDSDSFYECAKVLVSSSFLLEVVLLFSLSLESEDDSFKINALG
ncbi:hypothetical protein F8M41_017022 [Gigaspora margarita]|uniref:Uncharacterized protein n=1 Tax=Gigaspora margarita TaxID=4874 RepID=A0A8H4ANM1_GIGMA|nr:hypothetical protein F8M41_017022 [Gigaspora margarita]